MNIDIVNFARHATLKELRWLCGTQFPLWIQEGLRHKAAGEDTSEFLESLAEVCCVNEKTELLE